MDEMSSADFAEAVKKALSSSCPWAPWKPMVRTATGHGHLPARDVVKAVSDNVNGIVAPTITTVSTLDQELPRNDRHQLRYAALLVMDILDAFQRNGIRKVVIVPAIWVRCTRRHQLAARGRPGRD